MKNLHFCTPKLLEYIKDPKTNSFSTFRTGFIPNIYEGDIININERRPEYKDLLICKALVQDIITIKFWSINELHKLKGAFPEEEIKRYNRKFHPDHWFIKIKCKKVKNLDNFVK